MTPSHPPLLRRRLLCVLLLAITLPTGIVWRFAPLHLPWFAYKYGGSALWAVGVYWLVAALLPRWPPRRLALLAGAIALGVELFKRVHQPALDAFRGSFAGKVLLGRYFTLGALVAYGLAITAAALLDARLRPGRARTTVPAVPSR